MLSDSIIWEVFYRIRTRRQEFLMIKNKRTEISLSIDELRQVTLYSVTCARRVLQLFEATHSNDHRPREAIFQTETFAAGHRRTAALRRSAWAANAAAREVKEAPAANAAHAASHAAASAFLHPISSPHQVKHIIGAAIHQAIALELAAGNDKNVGSEQLGWAATLASMEVRNVLRRLAPPLRERGHFSVLLCDLDHRLRQPK
jgi:hypothetical protein